jgi:hypothetical protein
MTLADISAMGAPDSLASSCSGMQVVNSSSKSKLSNGSFNLRGGGSGGALDAGRLPSFLFPKL